MRFYVADLAAYNAGRLHGVWVDASTDTDEMSAAIAEMLNKSPVKFAEEWAVHDYEDMPNLGEYPGLEKIAVYAALAEVADDRNIPANVLIAAMSDRGILPKDVDSALSEAEDFASDCYIGTYESWKDFAEELAYETHDMKEVPEWVINHIDWESVARDYQCSGEVDCFVDGNSYNKFFFWVR